MDKILEILGSINHDHLIEVILSSPRSKADEIKKMTIRPILLNNDKMFQITSYAENKVYHSNVKMEVVKEELSNLINNKYKQIVIYTKQNDVHILVSKKGKITIKSKTPTRQARQLQHNRKKKYLLEEGNPVAFLIHLGVMTEEGKVIAQKYNKFKQINRFLEMIEDIIPKLDKTKELTIIDFGCGKSYLTFALYYYLKEICGFNIRVIGLDLKKDVIEYCNQLAEKFKFNDLKFIMGDIANFEGVNHVDMVVTLHACDTATDSAMAKAVGWGAEVILSVPCCQHELNNQISNKILKPILEYGIIKERIAALATDAIRANLLKQKGYDVQILEFIDLEHTPKNLLIRAIKSKKVENVEEVKKEYEDIKKFLSVEPSLEKFLSI